MSHVSVDETMIQNPDLALLKQAVDAVVADRQGELKDHWCDWYWTEQKDCLYAIYVKDMPRGIGVKVNQATPTKNLEFIGDYYGWIENRETGITRQRKDLWDEIAGDVIQNYALLAQQQVLQEMGYMVGFEEDESTPGQLITRAVQYA